MKVLQTFLDRFVSSASFSAYVRIVRWLALISPMYYYSNNNTTSAAGDDGIVTVTSALTLVGPLQTGLLVLLMPIATAGAICTGRLRGLQNVCAMLAGQALAFMIPVPIEPSGYLMVPTIVLYFGIIAGVGTALDLALNMLALPRPAEDAITAVFQQYLALFATTRAYVLFVAHQQERLLGLLCVVYLIGCPTVVRLDQTAYWRKHFLSCADGLAVRGGMLRVTAILAWFGGSTTGEALLAMPLLGVLFLLTTTTTTTTTTDNKNLLLVNKADESRTMLSLICAQAIVTLLCVSQRLSLSVALVVCLVFLLLLMAVAPYHKTSGGEEALSGICAFALSLLLVNCLERFLDGCGLPEMCFTYLCVFVLLECARSSTAWGAPVPPVNLGMLLLNEDAVAVSSALWA